jgi:DNA mismatch repair protein MutS
VRAIREALADDPAPLGSPDATIRRGFNAELDEVRTLARDGKSVIASIQQREAVRTGIPSLKVGYNKVFGYYLEVTNVHKEKVPVDFIRKQTLVNAERYVTPELKDVEERILDAQERVTSLEAEIFERLRSDIAEYSEQLAAVARDIAAIDAICSFASHAASNAWTRPVVDDSVSLEIVDGRHPVVEASLPVGEPFIPNSVRVDPDGDQILVITGPNMAGKSVVLRQTGIIVLLAQSGSFVPAAKARVGVVDRIFTRVGASDNLAEGESTFLVEMNEAANILNNATRRSLILLDEVGRGTSTFDGLSIAWAVVEHLHDNPAVAAKTLFATHYHELNELAARLERVRNYRILVQEHGGRVIFLRKLVAGGADHSYGIEVARMAGLPIGVIDRAREVLDFLERTPLVAPEVASGDGTALTTLPEPKPGRSSAHAEAVASKFIEALDLNRLTPIEALVKLNELKDLLK